MKTPSRKFEKFTLFMLIYSLVIILWGAWVRISGSGAGCGPHWPLCHGEVFINPDITNSTKTIIEYLHRLKSGVFGILVIVLYIWAVKIFPKKSYLRFTALMTLIFTITEALLGAKLVLFELVENDDSVQRAITMGLHLINTFTLLYFLSACWISAKKPVDFRPARINPVITFTMLVLVMIASSGTIAALASTLFPSTSILDGIKADFSADSHWLIRYRIIHPALAIILAFTSLALLQNLKSKIVNGLKSISILQILIICNICFGMLNIFTGPVSALKLMHLLIADLAWIAAVRVRLAVS